MRFNRIVLTTFFGKIFPKYRELVAAILLLTTVILIYFWPVWGQGKALFALDVLSLYSPWRFVFKAEVNNSLIGDQVRLYFPWRHFLLESLKQGHLPLWNPYQFSGVPFLANSQAAVLYPFNLLLFIGALTTGFTVFLLFHLLLASLGIYLLLRELECGFWAGVIAGVSFMFCGWVMVWFEFLTFTATVAWLPAAFLLVTRAVKRDSLPAVGGLALALGLQFLAGHIQFSYYTLVGLAFYSATIFLWWNKAISRLKQVIYVGASVFLGIGLAAAQLLPMQALSSTIVRGPENYWALRTVAFPPLHLISLILPSFFGVQTRNFYWSIGNYNEYIIYVGLLPLLLVFLAVAFKHARFRYARSFATVALVGFLGATGTPLYLLLMSVLPRFDQLRAPGRMTLLFSFGIAVLAGIGIQVLLDALKEGCHAKQFWPRLIIASLVLGAGWGYAVAEDPRTVEIMLLGGSPLRLSFVDGVKYILNQVEDRLPHLFVSILLFATILHWPDLRRAVTILTGSREKWGSLGQTFLPVALVMVLFWDFHSFAYDYNTYSEPTSTYPRSGAIEYLESHAATARFMRYGNEAPWLPMFQNTGIVYGLREIDGSDSFIPTRYARLYSIIIDEILIANRNQLGNILQPEALKSPLINMLNVKYLLTSWEFLPDLPAAVAVPEVPVGEILGQAEVGQTFKSTCNNLQRIKLLMGTYVRVNTQPLILTLRNASGDILVERQVPPETIPDTWYSFDFDPLPASLNQSYYIGLSSPTSQPGDAFTIWRSATDVYPVGEALINGEPIGADLVIKPICDLPTLADGQWVKVYDDEILIYENTAALPRAYIVHQAIPTSSEAELYEKLASPDFDPASELIYEVALYPDLASLSLSSAGQADEVVTLIEETPNKLIFETATKADGFLVVSDNYDEGWRARLDNTETPVYRVNAILKAVHLPAGRHRVELYYWPASLLTGIVVTLGSSLIIMLLLTSRQWLRWVK